MSRQSIKGYWYDGKQSGRQLTYLSVENNIIVIQELSESNTRLGQSSELIRADSNHVRFSPRIGNSARYLYFNEGQKFETLDNDGVDRLFEKLGKQPNASWLYKLETHLHFIILAMVLLVIVGFWTVTSGIPLAAKVTAHFLPDNFRQMAGQQTFEWLDEELFQPTDLTKPEQDRILSHFESIMQAYPDYGLQVHFRQSELMGANALALPDGSIVFTDGMVLLSENDDELLSIMAHEVGHVVENHGMRNVIQNSLVGFFIILLTGDLTGATELFLGLPILLTQTGYSRSFEREADAFALKYMQDNQIDPKHFVRIMTRLHNSLCDESVEEVSHDHLHDCENEGLLKYLSTHPSTKERIEKFGE